jgi:hypothetical protein
MKNWRSFHGMFPNFVQVYRHKAASRVRPFMAQLGRSKSDWVCIGMGGGFQIGKPGWFSVGISGGFHRNTQWVIQNL